MIILDYRDPRPIYEQVVQKLSELILAGVLAEGEQLPSVRTLAAELAVNPNTIQRAYAELERQGYTYPVKGRGSFVAGSEALKARHRAALLEECRQAVCRAAEAGIPEALLLQTVSEVCGTASGERQDKKNKENEETRQ